MADAPQYPTIPVPTEDPRALLNAVNALKQGYEMLTGQDKAQGYAAHTFVQDDMPTALHKGDFWLCTITSNLSFSIWNGDKWLMVGTITAVGLSGVETDALLLGKFHNRRAR